jgi:hypothetical protein
VASQVEALQDADADARCGRGDEPETARPGPTFGEQDGTHADKVGSYSRGPYLAMAAGAPPDRAPDQYQQSPLATPVSTHGKTVAAGTFVTECVFNGGHDSGDGADKPGPAGSPALGEGWVQ